MTTVLQKRAADAVLEWCKKNKLKPIGRPRHVYPRAFVVGRAAWQCLVVARPWVDGEPQCQADDKANPLATIHTFDKSLKAGDWCTCAYVCRDGINETVAIPVVA